MTEYQNAAIHRLLVVEEPKPKPAKIRVVSFEAPVDQLFKRVRSSSSALTQQAVSTPRARYPTKEAAKNSSRLRGEAVWKRFWGV